MKFKCEKYFIQNACQTASRAAASKSPIPALEGLLISAGAGVTVTGYDLKEGIFTTFAADVEEAGSVVIEAVRCGRSKYDIIGIESAEYPEIQKVEGLNRVSLPQKILKSMINETIFAIAETDVRPVYTGTLFEIEDGKLTLVSVDGYRRRKTDSCFSRRIPPCQEDRNSGRSCYGELHIYSAGKRACGYRENMRGYFR